MLVIVTCHVLECLDMCGYGYLYGYGFNTEVYMAKSAPRVYRLSRFC